VAYKFKSKILNAITTFLRPIKEVEKTGKSLVGGTKYQFKLIGALISAQAPKYDFTKIRQIYRRFGFIRQALAVYKNRATSEYPDVMCDNLRARNVLMDRLDTMNIFDQLPDMFQDLTSFGNVFYEILYDEEEIDIEANKKLTARSGGFDIRIPKEKDFKTTARRLNRIVGIKRLEPDYMRIVVNEYGQIRYYVNIRDSANYIVLERWRVIHIKLDPLPGDAWGIGLIESAVDDIAALRMVEDLQLQLIKHDIYPFRMFKCPTNEIVTEVENKLAEQERFGDLVVPKDVDMDQSSVGNASQDLRALMNFYEQKIFMDLGVPMQMLIEGSQTNRATAQVQSDAFNFNVYAFLNIVYLKMERFSKLVLLFEGIQSDVRWNYKDITRKGEQSVRKEIVEWYKESVIDREDAITLLDTYGGFRYLLPKQRNKIIRKSKPESSPLAIPGNPETPNTVELPPNEEDGATPELGDRIADTTKIEKPNRITDRIKEKVIKPDGSVVEKTTERIQQSVEFAERLRNDIMDCNFDIKKISKAVVGSLSKLPDPSVLNGQLDGFCEDIDLCIELYNRDENIKQYEYLISKSCAKLSRDVVINKAE